MSRRNRLDVRITGYSPQCATMHREDSDATTSHVHHGHSRWIPERRSGADMSRYAKAGRLLCRFTSHHITSHHITSYHITSYHIMSHHITSYHIISCRITSYHIISHHITSHHIIVPLLDHSFILSFLQSIIPSFITQTKRVVVVAATNRPGTSKTHFSNVLYVSNLKISYHLSPF